MDFNYTVYVNLNFNNWSSGQFLYSLVCDGILGKSKHFQGQNSPFLLRFNLNVELHIGHHLKAPIKTYQDLRDKGCGIDLYHALSKNLICYLQIFSLKARFLSTRQCEVLFIQSSLRMITYAVKWPGKNLIHAIVKCITCTSILAKQLGNFLGFFNASFWHYVFLFL